MKRIYTITLIASGILAGCSQQQLTREAFMNNPLYMQMYGDQVVDFVTNLEIYKNPVTEDPAKKAVIDATRDEWMPKIQESITKQRQGGEGGFVEVSVFTQGTTLYVDDTVYFSPNFITSPSPNLHVYITTAVDPRLVEFPDETSFDLGPLVSPYGAQEYSVPEVENPILYRTIVLWDEDLELVIGFAQLSYTTAVTGG